jgi:hypothetical protein
MPFFFSLHVIPFFVFSSPAPQTCTNTPAQEGPPLIYVALEATCVGVRMRKELQGSHAAVQAIHRVLVVAADAQVTAEKQNTEHKGGGAEKKYLYDIILLYSSLFLPSIHDPLSPLWPTGHVHGL